MARIVQIEKADPTYKGHVIEDVEIKIHKSISFDGVRDPEAFFKADAEDLFDALRSLPGGTFDQLLILMLQKAASSFVVPYNFHDEEKPRSSMLALLEKALPLVEAENVRRSVGRSSAVLPDEPYWTEANELANKISAEIDKARGKGVSDGQS